MSPDLNPIDHLWDELKYTIRLNNSTNVQELEQLAKGRVGENNSRLMQ